jgi:hypothetical protein
MSEGTMTIPTYPAIDVIRILETDVTPQIIHVNMISVVRCKEDPSKGTLITMRTDYSIDEEKDVKLSVEMELSKQFHGHAVNIYENGIEDLEDLMKDGSIEISSHDIDDPTL